MQDYARLFLALRDRDPCSETALVLYNLIASFKVNFHVLCTLHSRAR